MKKEWFIKTHYMDAIKSSSNLKRLSTTAANALINARRSQECKDYKEAKINYRIVLMEYPENWEAFFYRTYCEAMEGDISRGATAIANCIEVVLKDIKKLETTEQNEAIKQIYADLNNYFWSITNSYDVAKDISRNARSLQEFETLYLDNIIPNITTMLKLFGDKLVLEIGKNELTNSIKIQCYEYILETYPRPFNAKILEMIANELKIMNPLSPVLMEYESRGFLKKYWDNQDSVQKYTHGCGGCFIVFMIIVLIIEELTRAFR